MINPDFLKAHELAYEVAIRIGKEDVAKTVEQNRKLLRGLLAQEKGDRSFTEIQDVYTVSENVKELLLSISDLTDKISKLTPGSNVSDFKRIEDRLSHCSKRLHRILVEDDCEEKQKREVAIKIIELEADFYDCKPTEKCVTSTPTVPSVLVSSHLSSCNKVPVYKWNLKKFSGKEPLIPFLELIDTLKISRGCTDTDLFESASDLFELDAWNWWHNHFVRKTFSNWSELVNALKDTFLHSNYDHILLDEIKSRKQRSGENVSVFITTLESQFHRLTRKVSEREMVDIIRANLQSEFVGALVLRDIDTLSDLNSLCKRVENVLDLNRRKPYSVAQFESITCWNCRKLGHKYTFCKKPRSTFCFGCGTAGVIKSKCFKCSKNAKPGHVLAENMNQPGPSIAAKGNMNQRK